MHSMTINRRRFLKLSGLGLAEPWLSKVTRAAERQINLATVSILGTPGRYAIGIDLGSAVQWGHSNSGVGDFDFFSAAGESHLNVVYDDYSVNGPITTFTPTSLASGLSVETILENKGNNTFKITHRFVSKTDRWIKICKYLRDRSGGSSVAGTSTVERYNDTADAASDLTAFHAAALHHPSGVAAGMIAGNGYANDYCIIDWGSVAHTNWYNTNILSKHPDHILLTYGLLKNLSSTDYTVQLLADTPRTLSYVLCICHPTLQSTLNAALYNAYYGAYCDTARANPVDRMLWSTGHQLQRIKRHILVEGSKVMTVAPVNRGYSGMISAGDMIFTTLGVGDEFMMREVLKTFHSCGAPTGAAITSSVMGGPDTVMDGSYALYIPYVELFAKTFLKYMPDAIAQSKYLQIADSYADTINNVKMIPSASTRLAHLYSDVFGGTEGIGMGDFEEPFSFAQDRDTVDKWTEEVAGTASTARVGVDHVVSPHSGRYQSKLVSSGADSYARRRLMPIAVPPSKELTVTACVNIPSAYSSGGFRFHIIERDSALATVATTTSPTVATTSGYQPQSFAWTLNSAANYVEIAIEGSGTGTVYVDDVQCTMKNPPYPGLFWSVTIMPPQIHGNKLSPGAFSMNWVQLNLKCLKVLLGSSWNSSHETALAAVDNTYPFAYWTDAGQTKIREDLYHHVRKNWLTSWTLFSHYMWYVLSGEKILSDQQVANIYTNFPKTSAGGPYGDVAFKGWIMNQDGSAVGPEADFLSTWTQTPGYYINGGCWLWAADTYFYRSAVWAGVPGAEAARLKRLLLEVHPAYASHESISAGGGLTLEGYGANALMLVEKIDRTRQN